VASWKGRRFRLVRDRSQAANSLICIWRSCGAGTGSRVAPGTQQDVSAGRAGQRVGGDSHGGHPERASTGPGRRSGAGARRVVALLIAQPLSWRRYARFQAGKLCA
jgi:hypothetical protein